MPLQPCTFSFLTPQSCNSPLSLGMIDPDLFICQGLIQIRDGWLTANQETANVSLVVLLIIGTVNHSPVRGLFL